MKQFWFSYNSCSNKGSCWFSLSSPHVFVLLKIQHCNGNFNPKNLSESFQYYLNWSFNFENGTYWKTTYPCSSQSWHLSWWIFSSRHLNSKTFLPQNWDSKVFKAYFKTYLWFKSLNWPDSRPQAKMTI